ncbi:MAG: protein-glutamate O-methyltransferase CheR [Acidobacteriota bacterium]|nr:protein-glutamate O-methyltransferase CheR [Acidobacteriota bacterium]
MTVANDQFTFLQELVYKRSAMVLSDSKAYLAESRLMPLARAIGISDTGEFVAHVRRSRDVKLEEQVVEAMTINETLWFRDKRPFDALRSHVLPDLVSRKASARQLSIWSAASSSGQELYSVAILLEESFPQLRDWRVSLLGTDLSREMVDKANSGVYSSMEMNRGLPAAMLVRYFSQSGSSYRLSDTIRSKVRFQQMNLAATPWPSLPVFDVILLRNVLIYFDVGTKQRILQEARRRLSPGGYLLLGTAETTSGLSGEFDTVSAEGAVFYRVKER